MTTLLDGFVEIPSPQVTALTVPVSLLHLTIPALTRPAPRGFPPLGFSELSDCLLALKALWLPPFLISSKTIFSGIQTHLRNVSWWAHLCSHPVFLESGPGHVERNPQESHRYNKKAWHFTHISCVSSSQWKPAFKNRSWFPSTLRLRTGWIPSVADDVWWNLLSW